MSLTFIRHTRLNTLVCVCVIEPQERVTTNPTARGPLLKQRLAAVLFQGSEDRWRETQSEVSLVCCSSVLEVHFNDLIMIDC